MGAVLLAWLMLLSVQEYVLATLASFKMEAFVRSVIHSALLAQELEILSARAVLTRPTQ